MPCAPPWYPLAILPLCSNKSVHFISFLFCRTDVKSNQFSLHKVASWGALLEAIAMTPWIIFSGLFWSCDFASRRYWKHARLRPKSPDALVPCTFNINVLSSSPTSRSLFSRYSLCDMGRKITTQLVFFGRTMKYFRFRSHLHILTWHSILALIREKTVCYY